MILKVTQSKNVFTRKVTFGKFDANNIEWTRRTRISEIDNTYVDVDRPEDARVAIGRAFAFHLRNCGVLDGYSQAVFVPGDFKPHYQCKVNMTVGIGATEYVIRLELSYVERQTSWTPEFFEIDMERVNVYLYDCIVQKEGRNRSFEMKMRYALALRKVRVFIDDLELEL